MNKIINKFLLTGETFMPELYLKQTVFICGQFTRHRERIKNKQYLLVDNLLNIVKESKNLEKKVA